MNSQIERENIIKTKNREKIISHVLNDLRSLEEDNFSQDQKYAINENFLFFKAAKSLAKYIIWLFKRAPHIRGSDLLELTDLPFPHWDQKMHLKLVELE